MIILGFLILAIAVGAFFYKLNSAIQDPEKTISEMNERFDKRGH